MHQAAVTRVITLHLQETGERPEGADVERSVRHAVRRALIAERVTPPTLSWFVEAFEMTSADKDRLHDLLHGRVPDPLPVVRRGRLRTPPGLPSTDDHETLSLSELHTLGPDGTPTEHRTLQVLRALSPISSYRYRFDTAYADVEVLAGGRAGPVEPIAGTLAGTRIELTTPLRTGQTALLEYRTTFRYPRAPEPQHRRAALHRVERVTMRVQFHPRRLPQAVWWNQWDDLEGPPVSREAADVAVDGSVHRLLGGLEAAVVGFTWTF